MASHISPLVGTPPTTRKGDGPEVGALVTVLLRKGDGFVESGARVECIAYGTTFVKLVGLEVPEPYQVGDRYPLPTDKVVDW